MNTLRIPKVINFGKDALSEAEYPKNALVVTTAPPALSGKWLDRMGIEDYMLYDKVTPEPSIDDVNGVISEFKSKDPSVIIGLGGGSSMDVVKYSAPEMGKEKILIPTTFGTGAEMTTYCVLKFDGKKKLLREDKFLADRAGWTFHSEQLCMRCMRARQPYDSKLGNDFTRAMCNQAFDMIARLMLSGIGFKLLYTLGHALSVFANEGVPHGYSLSSCTTVARVTKIIKKPSLLSGSFRSFGCFTVRFQRASSIAYRIHFRFVCMCVPSSLLSYPSVACAHASHTELRIHHSKYESLSARNLSSRSSFFLPSNFNTQYVVISAPVPKVVGMRIFSLPISGAEYFTTSIELPPPSPIITDGSFDLNSDITPFTSSMDGSGVTLSYSM